MIIISYPPWIFLCWYCSSKGMTTLKEFSALDVHSMDGKDYMNSDTITRLTAAVDKLNLELWLQDNGVKEVFPVLVKEGYTSLKDLCKLTMDSNLQVRMSDMCSVIYTSVCMTSHVLSNLSLYTTGV